MRWTCYNDRTTPRRIRVIRLVKMLQEQGDENITRLWLDSWIIPEVKSLFPEVYDRETGEKIPKKLKKEREKNGL